MDAMEYIITGVFLLIALYLITQPLFDRGRDADRGGIIRPGQGGDRLASLQAKKSLIDENISDLEFEYRMDKLTKEDFERLQAGCAEEARALQQAMSGLRGDQSIDEQIEQAVRKRRRLG
jgi:hypothetical protein